MTSYRHEPSICLIAQGSKRALLGDEVYGYDAHHFLLVSVDLRIDDLATEVRMSTSAFHHHFRALTTMSPLPYQKRLRLHEARQLMFTEQLDASNAAFQVG